MNSRVLPPPEVAYTWIVKCCVYAVMLVVIVAGNAMLYQHASAQSKIRKWNAAIFLIKLLSVCGILNGLVNVAAADVHSVSGKSTKLSCDFCLMQLR